MRDKLLLKETDRPMSEQLEALRDAWRKGIASGKAGEIEFGELRQAAKREYATRKRRV